MKSMKTPDHENYSWEWLAQKVDPALIPLAKIYVQQPGSGIYWNRTWSNGKEITSEEANLRGFCKHFDPYYVGEDSDQSDHNFSLISMVVDTLGTAWDTLKALAMVEGGEWSKLPDIYNDEGDFNFLKEKGLVVKKNKKWQISCKPLLDHALLVGRFVWDRGEYDPEKDTNHSAFYIKNELEISKYVRDKRK